MEIKLVQILLLELMLLLLQKSFMARTAAASVVILKPAWSMPGSFWSASTSARSPICSAGCAAADSAM